MSAGEILSYATARGAGAHVRLREPWQGFAAGTEGSVCEDDMFGMDTEKVYFFAYGDDSPVLLSQQDFDKFEVVRLVLP